MSNATTHIEIEKRSAERSRSKLAPALRFKEFEGEWSKKKLSKVCQVNPKAEKLPNSFIYVDLESVKKGVLGKEERINKIDAPSRAQRLLTKNDILYQTVRPYQKNNYFFSKNNLDYVASTGYAQIRTDNSAHYIFQLLHTELFVNKVLLRCTGTSYPAINSSDLKSIPINIPTLPEQQKIASFLSAVDEKIQQLTKKKALLEDYKKGVMQQLFPSTGSGQRSGQLRFKDANGKAYPDWEDTLLGDCLKYVQPTKYLVSSTEYDNSFETPVLTAGKTFVLGYTDEKENICTDYPLIIFDDFTTASKYVDFPFKAKSSAMKLLLAKEGVDVKFMFEAMQNIKFEVGGHGRHWISIFSQLIVSVPSINEQQKIATYLSRIDTKIEAVNNQITQTQTFKKGLLQQMFV